MIRWHIVLLYSLILLPVVTAVNVCQVDVSEDQVIRDGADDVISIDYDGDVAIYSDSVTEFTTPSNRDGHSVVAGGSFQHVFRAGQAVIDGVIGDNGIGSVSSDDAVITDSAGNPLLAYRASGDLDISGEAAYQGAQANCPSDGYYCDGNTKEDRNYYCDISSASCTFSVTSSTACSTGATEYDSGSTDFDTDSYCKDYTGCSGGSCESDYEYDYCSGDTIYEAYASGGSCSYNSQDCTQICSGERPGTGCSGDTCNYGSACSTGATDYDDGIDYRDDSYVKDYTGCSGGSCESDYEYDYCSGDTIYEQYVSAGNAYTDSADCTNQCFGDRPGTSCSGDTCNTGAACDTGASDTDGGIDYYEKGTCTDSEGCSSGSCQTSTDTDSCSSGTLTEYYASGGSCLSETHTCDNGCANDGACVENSPPIAVLDKMTYGCTSSDPDIPSGCNGWSGGTITEGGSALSIIGGGYSQDPDGDSFTWSPSWSGPGYADKFSTHSIDVHVPIGTTSSDTSGTLTNTVTDEHGASASASGSLSVTAREANPDTASVEQGGSTTISVGANDDYNPSGALVDITSASGASKGSLNIDTSAGTVTYNADATATGTDTFSYEYTGQHGGTEGSTVTVTVNVMCYPDSDDDGYGDESSSGTSRASCNIDEVRGSNNDCDDSDASVNPGANEVCGDGVDNDCDGQVDEGCNQPPEACVEFNYCTGDPDTDSGLYPFDETGDNYMSCSNSNDVDGSIVGCDWSVNGPGYISETKYGPDGAQRAYIAAKLGSVSSDEIGYATLTVTDDDGATASRDRIKYEVKDIDFNTYHEFTDGGATVSITNRDNIDLKSINPTAGSVHDYSISGDQIEVSSPFMGDTKSKNRDTIEVTLEGPRGGTETIDVTFQEYKRCGDDSDYDDYAASGTMSKVYRSCSASEAEKSGDCNDNDDRIYPGAPGQAEPRPDTGGYDWDCDGDVSLSDGDHQLCNPGGWTEYNYCSDSDYPGGSCRDTGFCSFDIEVCNDPSSKTVGDLGLQCGDTVNNADHPSVQLCDEGTSSCADTLMLKPYTIYNSKSCQGKPGRRFYIFNRVDCA